MRKLLFFTLVWLCSIGIIYAQEQNRLHYDKPAKEWTEALPLGNGRLGAMVYGGVVEEQIQFNEETLWAGRPHSYAHEGAYKYLAEIRQLLEDGKQIEAQELAQQKFMSEPLKQMPYQPFGDLYLSFRDHQDYSNYHRELDIENALAKLSYKVADIKYTREVFASYPHQIIVLYLTASEAEALNFELWLDAQHEQKQIKNKGNGQTLEVKVKDGALRGFASIQIDTDGEISKHGGKLSVTKATKTSIYLTTATNYKNYQDVSGEPELIVNSTLEKLEQLSQDEIKSAHLNDYHALFKRFSIEFGGNSKSEISTDQRIIDFWKKPEDPQLIALYVQYARYLMIASSRPGTLPTNLQGIWNDKMDPPWLSGYTSNINLEMNYWPVELANLSECHEPLFDFIEDISKTGEVVAQEHYGAEGWVAHHNIDLWRGTAPVNASHHGIWVTAGAWLCTHIWEHYLFSKNEEFLRDKYPLIKEASRFFSQFLYKDPHTGYLISSPSNSPEIGGLVAGPTMDHQIIRALFEINISAAKILGVDDEFSAKLSTLLPQIAPNQIGQHGQLQEWLEDKDDPENHHRHVSHLWAVYPGNEINYEETPELMEAARQSLEYRGDNGTGWSLAWKVNFWARFRDGNRAYKLLHGLLSPAEHPERKNKGGSYPNLFDAHPPFQIDGNFGGASGILEMLVQSHLGKIELLPALPYALAEGKVAGLRARGGFELSFAWADSQLEEVEVTSLEGGPCRLKYQNKVIEFDTEAGKTYSFNAALKEI